MYRGKPLPITAPRSGIRSVNFTHQSDSDESAGEQEEEVTSQAHHDVVIVDAEEEEQMSQFMSSNPMERRTLADIIQDKLTEKRTEIHTQMSGLYLISQLSTQRHSRPAHNRWSP